MAGFFMGILSRRSILINGSLLRLLLLLGELMRPPGNRLGVHGPMYALAFYRVVFPLMVLSLLVILPSILGMRRGVRVHAVPRLLQLILVVVLFVAAAERRPVRRVLVVAQITGAAGVPAIRRIPAGRVYADYCHNDPVEIAQDKLLIRPATERDYPAIVRIQQHCPETAQWPLGDYSGFPVLVALIGSVHAGFCSWRQSAPDEAEVLNLAVDPPWRRRGVGSALLGAVIERAQGTIFLEVAEPNSPAIALYRKQGWVDVGLRSGYYNHGTVNAVVMKKSSW